MTEPKLCKGCDYSTMSKRCIRPDELTGFKIFDSSCGVQRYFKNECGIEAKYFKPRRSFLKRLFGGLWS